MIRHADDRPARELSPTPWRRDEEACIYDANGVHIGEFVYNDDARRVVEAVNAEAQRKTA